MIIPYDNDSGNSALPAHLFQKIRKNPNLSNRLVQEQPKRIQKLSSSLTYDNKFERGLCDCCEDCKICSCAFFCFPW